MGTLGGEAHHMERVLPASDGCRQPGRSRARLPTPDAGRGGLGGRGYAARAQIRLYNVCATVLSGPAELLVGSPRPEWPGVPGLTPSSAPGADRPGTW